jgi:putative ABC transport system ATP-binding protein
MSLPDTVTPTDAGVQPVVVIERVSKSYREGDGDHVVLDGVSATVDRGEIIALLGPSGSGKSTLLNIIGGIDIPTSGDVTIDGEVVTRMSERERTLFRRSRIGFVFQFFNLIPTLTVAENLLLPLELLGRMAQRDRAYDLLERVGLARRADTFPDRLSGGEQQRIAIARALVHEPPLLLADEPTGNLDAETGETVLDLLVRLTREAGRTMIVATHSERIVERASGVLTIRHARLQPPEDAMADGAHR